MRCGFLPGFGKQEGQQALHDIDLLVAIQPAGEAAPEDPPVDFVLGLIGELRPRRVNAADLFDAEFVADIAEAGTQAEAAEIQPADFMRGAAFAVFDLFEEDVGQTARDIHRPGVAAEAESGFEARRKFFGRDSCADAKAARTSSQAASTASPLTTAAGRRAVARASSPRSCEAGTAGASGCR